MRHLRGLAQCSASLAASLAAARGSLRLRAALFASAPRTSRLPVTLLVGLLALALVLVPSAHAIYGPTAGGFGADIVSIDNASDEQGNAATTDADISADGRYVVFQTQATNFFEDDGGVIGAHGVEPDAEPSGTLREGGIFRYDRLTGKLQLVADGSEVNLAECPERRCKLIFRGAQNPSVSADGRYVAFSTAQKLVPQDHNENVDVYVRDMNVPLTADRSGSGAYTLVSATDGTEQPAAYAQRNPPLKGAEPGAEVWPNTSISADGHYVVFRTTELESNLPDHATVDTPPRQLFVRDLSAKTTTLVSRDTTSLTHPSGDPAGGATGPATISADGTTVAWVADENLEAQTRFLSGESPVQFVSYYLWRRWQDPTALTRRPTGWTDPDDPACPPEAKVIESETATGPCYGPLNSQESRLGGIAGVAPGLSADGYTVAFLAGAALRPNITKPSGLDVFLTSMRPGVSRKQGTRELTLAANSGNPGSAPSIESLALSSDGSTLAFTSTRDDFVLPEPTPVGMFRPLPTANDLYVVNLAQNTLERAVVSYEGGDPDGSISVNPTLTENGSQVAFTSSASNLIFGDSNESTDAFAATLQAPAGTAGPSPEVNAVQGGFSLSASASPELGLHVKRGKNGALILLVETPGPGRLTALARGTVSVRQGKRTRKRKVALAHASGVARSEGTTTLLLSLGSRYVKDLKRAGRLSAAIVVDFKPPPTAEALSVEASATFTAASSKKGGSGASAKAGTR
jgi:Tol biopolymer transport system component